MPVSRIISAAILLGLLALPALAAPALAADSPDGACLNKTEQRAAVAARKAVPLAQAIRSLREQGRWAEVVRARLCRRGEGLVYVLTLLARNGKVTRATVDAANGTVMNGR